MLHTLNCKGSTLLRGGFVICAVVSPLMTSTLLAQLQTQITNAENAGGGTVQLAAGTTTITSTLVFRSGFGNVRLVGAGMGATIISYQPSGTASDAIQIGNSSGTITNRVGLEDLTIDVSNPVSASCSSTASMAAIHAISTQFLFLKNVEVVTRQGCSTASGQTAISLDGSGLFSADTTIVDPRIVGDFTTGLLITGSSTQYANATTMVGGALVNTTSPRVSGTNGINVQFGDTTSVFNTDVEDWNTGVYVGFSGDGPFSVREEGNATDWEVASGVNGTSFEGALFSTMSDSGTNTIYSSHANGGVIQSKVASGFVLGAGPGAGCVFNTGAGSPNGGVTGNPCDIYLNTNGGTGTTLYVKETGSGTSSGWVAK